MSCIDKDFEQKQYYSIGLFFFLLEFIKERIPAANDLSLCFPSLSCS